jgi:small GTP-binding protein
MAEKRKVCMLGATGVGKTSVTQRFVRSIFSEAYRTTIGVIIEKRRLWVDGRALDLVIWDLSGEDEFQRINLSYIRGAGGLLMVIDGTRRETTEAALRLHAATRAIVGGVPCVFVLNKADLMATWEIDEGSEDALRRAGFPLVKTSAKTGAGVLDAFCTLARAMMIGDHERAS